MARCRPKDDVCLAAVARDLHREAGAWERVGQMVRARRLRRRLMAILEKEPPCTPDQACYDRCLLRRERTRLGFAPAAPAAE